jgi:hypothetical protein
MNTIICLVDIHAEFLKLSIICDLTKSHIYTEQFVKFCICFVYLRMLPVARTSVYTYLQCQMIECHVKWVHCHHGMARPRVADRGYGCEYIE